SPGDKEKDKNQIRKIKREREIMWVKEMKKKEVHQMIVFFQVGEQPKRTRSGARSGSQGAYNKSQWSTAVDNTAPTISTTFVRCGSSLLLYFFLRFTALSSPFFPPSPSSSMFTFIRSLLFIYLFIIVRFAHVFSLSSNTYSPPIPPPPPSPLRTPCFNYSI
ncbi:hypothetical protein TSMEX_008647, partial [Taenia solium]